MPTGDPFCPCGCGSWLGQCSALRYIAELYPRVAPTADENLLAELDHGEIVSDIECFVPGCFVCSGALAARAREGRT